jgi:2,4-dienoyl-CoA reductase-like NADH-dependent reductase (Old Yellow Enzyme family)
MASKYARMARLKNAENLQEYLAELGVEIPFEENLEAGDGSPMAQPLKLRSGKKVGNRFAVLPMEGWDGTRDGLPTEETIRRWRNFGLSGAKLIWGCEAVAVRHDGRANPNQLVINEHTLKGLAELRTELLKAHHDNIGSDDDLLVGLQLTHSGRFARPNEKARLEPRVLYDHPLLSEIFKSDDDTSIMSDSEIDTLIGEFIRAAKQAYELGFEFVDIKHCHGYLGHEFLSAYTRPGRYGGSFENRTRFLRDIVAGIRQEAPGLMIGVRLSGFDFPPFRKDENGVGQVTDFREKDGTYPYSFGGDRNNPLQIDLDEPLRFLDLMESLDIQLLNLSAGSPYYNPHVTRPAYFPPSDGYLPPEDPLIGVARQINTVSRFKAAYPDMAIVGSGYSYLQDWLPNVAQSVVRQHMVDFVGLGRMILSYPEMPADVLSGNVLARKKICRTFSDCTTAPRNGMISGCYPLDDFYKQKPEADRVKEIKKNI